MTQRELEELLQSCIVMGLKKHRYRLPKTPDNVTLDRYYASAAEAIITQVKFSWTIEPPSTVRKKAPLEPH